MISVSKAGPERLSLYVSEDEPAETREVLQSLLGVRHNPNTGTYFLPVWDFPILAEKLARVSPNGERLMDGPAWEVLRDYRYHLSLNEEIKAGTLNHEIEALLAQAGVKSSLWTDQVGDVRFCVRNAICGVFSEMGTGKSLCALATFALLRFAGLARYALVIVPNAVKQNWVRQTTQHTTLTATELGNGGKRTLSRLKAYEKARTDVCITHYEALRNQDFREALVKIPFDMTVMDEAHSIKNQSLKTQAALAVMSQIRSATELVKADVELQDGTLVSAVLPGSVKPGDEVHFW